MYGHLEVISCVIVKNFYINNLTLVPRNYFSKSVGIESQASKKKLRLLVSTQLMCTLGFPWVSYLAGIINFESCHCWETLFQPHNKSMAQRHPFILVDVFFSYVNSRSQSPDSTPISKEFSR